MGPTTLFIHLKIILLQYFQFSIFSFSNNKFNPIGPYITYVPNKPKAKKKIIINKTLLILLQNRDGKINYTNFQLKSLEPKAQK